MKPDIDEIGNKFWCLNGKLHREDGPAVEFENGDKVWFLNNVCLTEQEWLDRVLFNEVNISLL